MKIAVGEKVAGKFQYNRFAALMNNRTYYEKSYAATQGASGMMDQMNDIYMQSIEGRLNTLQAAGEEVMSTLFDQDSVEPVIEQATKLLNVLNDIVDAAGGLSGVVQALGAIMLRTFSTQIAGTISNIATSISTVISNSRNSNQLATSVNLLGLNNYAQSQGSSVAGKLVSSVASNYDKLSVGTQEKIRDLSQQIVELEQQKTNVIKEQERYFGNIKAKAADEAAYIENSIGALRVKIRLLTQKEKTDKLTSTEIDDLATYRQQIQDLRKINSIYLDIQKGCSNYMTILAKGGKLTQTQIDKVQQ